MTTEGQEAEIAVGEQYGDALWRIKEVETGNVLLTPSTQNASTCGCSPYSTAAKGYADEQQARRAAAAPDGA